MNEVAGADSAVRGRAGVPGIAWSDKVLSVRVVRDRRAEVFALAMHDASKLGGIQLAPDTGRSARGAAARSR